MNKKSNFSVIYFSIVIIALIIVVIAVFLRNGKDDKQDTIKKKIGIEISYLDTYLIDMLNNANGISLENYIVQAEKVKEDKSSKSGDTSTSSSSSSGGSSEGGSSSGESSSGEGGSEGEEQSNSDSSSNNVTYKMTGNEILLQERKIDWNDLKSDVEKLYIDWSTIVLDLYKVNVNNQDILNFSTELDVVTTAIQEEDKTKTLNSLARLYSYIPKYSAVALDNAKGTSLYQTKSSVLNAYALVEQDDFSKIKDELNNAENSFMPILSDINSNTSNQTNINKSYIMIKELENFDANTNKEIFYIKYKNLIQNLNDIKV